MAQIINTGKELIRINPNDSNRLEYSTNSGKSWHLCFSSKSCGDFKDLTENGKEILATTSLFVIFCAKK
jgi:hypothetical protein